MNNLKSNLFNRATQIAAALKKVRVDRLLILVFAGILVITTTACNPSSPSVSGTGSYQERVGQPQGLREYTDRADGKSRPDLSSYRDNDYRATSKADAKAKELTQRADRNAQKVQSPEDFAESYRQGTPLQERVRNLSDDIGGSAKQLGEDVSKGTQENLRNLRGNVDKAKQNAQRSTDAIQDRA